MRTESADLVGVLAVLADAVDQGLVVSPHRNAPANAYKVLHPMPGFPSLVGRAELDELLLCAEQLGYITSTEFRSRSRKRRLTWALTEAGRDLVTHASVKCARRTTPQPDHDCRHLPTAPIPERADESSSAPPNWREVLLSRLQEIGHLTPAVQAEFIVHCLAAQRLLDRFDEAGRRALRAQLVYALLDDDEDGGSYFRGEVGRRRAVAILGALDVAGRQFDLPPWVMPMTLGAPGLS